MAVAVDNTGASAGGTALTTKSITSFAVGAGANRFLFVGVSQWKASDTQPTGNFNTSETFTAHDNATVAEGAGTRRVTILYRIAPSNATATVKVDWATSCDELVVGATSWTGVHQTTPLGTAVKNTSAGSATSTVTVSNTSGDAVHDTLSADADASGSGTATANQTQRWRAVATALTTEGAGQSAAGAGSNIACTWSTINGGGGGNLAHIGVAIKQVAAGGGNPFPGDIGSTNAVPVKRTLTQQKGWPIDGRTYIDASEVWLIGKDAQFAGPGQFKTYDWTNPVKTTYIQTKFPIEFRTFIGPNLLRFLGLDTFFAGPGQEPAKRDWPAPAGPRSNNKGFIQSTPPFFNGKIISATVVVANWTVPAGFSVVATRNISATGVPANWVVGTPTYKQRTAPAVVVANWVVPTASISSGGSPQSISATVVTASWTSPTALVARKVSATGVVANWTVPAVTLTPGKATLTMTAVQATWTVPAVAFNGAVAAPTGLNIWGWRKPTKR